MDDTEMNKLHEEFPGTLSQESTRETLGKFMDMAQTLFDDTAISDLRLKPVTGYVDNDFMHGCIHLRGCHFRIDGYDIPCKEVVIGIFSAEKKLGSVDFNGSMG